MTQELKPKERQCCECWTHAMGYQSIWILVLLFLAYPVQAQVWVDENNCALEWDPPTEGGPVQGYRVHLESQDPVNISILNVGNVLSVECASLNPAVGLNTAFVTAYNPVGESPPSNTVSFLVVKFPPGAPLTLRVNPNPLQQ